MLHVLFSRLSIPGYGWFGLFINTLGISLTAFLLSGAVSAMILVASTSFVQVGSDESVERDPRCVIHIARECAWFLMRFLLRASQRWYLLHSAELHRAR